MTKMSCPYMSSINSQLVSFRVQWAAVRIHLKKVTFNFSNVDLKNQGSSQDNFRGSLYRHGIGNIRDVIKGASRYMAVVYFLMYV